MPKSKTDKSRKKKIQNFKTQQKKMSEQQKQGKQQLFPVPEWQSTDTLDLPGDVLEAFEVTLRAVYEQINNVNAAFNNLVQIGQMITKKNIENGKIKLGYVWNNGEKPTEEEINAYKAQVEFVKKAQKAEAEKEKAKQNGEKTGLVGLDGEPIGSTQNLNEDGPLEEELDAVTS